MGEVVPKSEAETAIQRSPSAYAGAEKEVLAYQNVPGKFESDDLGQEEDFLDPKHPQYGTVDEHGRPLPGWLDQITVRRASAATASVLDAFAQA